MVIFNVYLFNLRITKQNIYMYIYEIRYIIMIAINNVINYLIDTTTEERIIEIVRKFYKLAIIYKESKR